MTNESDSVIDQFFKLDHPLVHKFKQLEEEAFKLPTTNDAEKFIADWKKNNPKEAEEMRVFLHNFGVEHKESRREVKSELGYSRIGRNNV